MKEERNLLDYIYVLVKWRRMILLSVLSVSIAAAGVAMILPERWTASTILLPPEEETDTFGLSSLLGNVPVPANLGQLVGSGPPSERLLTILASKRVLGTVVDRFGLVEEYGAPNRELAIQYLDESIERELGGEGSLTISVTADDPVLAADITNALAAELDEINRLYKSQQARVLRQFLEERMQVMQDELERSGKSLQHFQEAHGVVDIEAQTAATVEVIKNVVQELTMLEVKLGLSRRLLSEEHEERQELELEVVELRRQLGQLIGEGGDGEDNGVRMLGPPIKELPELGRQYTQLTLALKVKEGMMAVLGSKLEEMRYKEALNTPTLQVLDPATPPEFRSAPKRTLIVVVAAAVSLVVGLLFSFFLEAIGMLSLENREKIQSIKGLMGRSAGGRG